MGLDERVKPRMSQALTRDARPDSNSRPAVQISNSLPSRYDPETYLIQRCTLMESKGYSLLLYWMGHMLFTLCV